MAFDALIPIETTDGLELDLVAKSLIWRLTQLIAPPENREDAQQYSKPTCRIEAQIPGLIQRGPYFRSTKLAALACQGPSNPNSDSGYLLP